MASERQTEDLRDALRETAAFLLRYGYEHVSGRLLNDEARLAAGDFGAIQSALSEATGSAGSLRDVSLYPENAGEHVAANARLDELVKRIERLARAALSP